MSVAPPSTKRTPQAILGLRSVGASAAHALLAVWRAARAAARRGWKAATPVVGVVGPMGWFVLLTFAASLVAGLTLGWPELTYLAATLLGAMLVAALFLIGKTNYQVRIELEPSRVVVGERALGRMLVTNVLEKRSLPTRMELPVGKGLAEFTIPALAPGADHDELFAVPTNRRAVIIAGPALTVRGDQLGLLRRAVRWTEPIELFVHPATARIASSATGLVRDLEGETTKTITSNDISFHALRQYQPGDPLRNVHWRTSARTGQLMVRQFEETRRSQLLILFSAERRFFASDDEFELAISAAASLGVQVIRDGSPVSVITEDRALRTGTPTALLDDTCRIEPVDGRYATAREFARTATRRLPAPSVVMLVTGSQMEIADFRSVATVFGEDTRRIVVRAEVGASPQLHAVSDVSIATLGSLDDLPRLIRRVQP
jgi:hypothetical protein